VTGRSFAALLPQLAVVVPLLLVGASALARGAARIAVVSVGPGLIVLIAAALAVTTTTGMPPLRVLNAAPGLEMVLVADGFAVAMVAMTSVICAAVAAFATLEDLADPRARDPRFWPIWFALWAALHLLFLAGDLLTAYLMLEAIGVTGAALVALGGDRSTVGAATRYLYAELVASTTVLAGIALIWWQTDSLRFTALGPELVTAPMGWLALGVTTTGLLLKMPLAPIHLWLPAAHALAPSAVSPVLSAVVVKSAFAVMVRLWFVTAPGLVTRSAAQLVGALGVVAIVWGSVVALRAGSVKELIAYSTVAQLGFLTLLVPLVEAGNADAWRGGVLYAVAHALAKAALLMAAAVVVETAGRADLDALSGAASRSPLAVFAIGVGALSLVGLPPSGGFVAKWYLLTASLESGQWWWIPPILLGSLLTAAYLLRLLKRAFTTGARSDGPASAGGARSTQATFDRRGAVALGLSLTTVALGVRPLEVLELLDLGAPALTGGR
jgi:multicomponent Na+:H+ antiporter subunit D